MLIQDELAAQRDPQQRTMEQGGTSVLWQNIMFSQNQNNTNPVTPLVQPTPSSSQKKAPQPQSSAIMARVQERNGHGTSSSSLNLNLKNTNTQTGPSTRRGMNVPKQAFEIDEDEQVRLARGLHVGDFVRIEYSSGSDESDQWHKAEAFVGAKDQDGRLSLTLLNSSNGNFSSTIFGFPSVDAVDDANHILFRTVNKIARPARVLPPDLRIATGTDPKSFSKIIYCDGGTKNSVGRSVGPSAAGITVVDLHAGTVERHGRYYLTSTNNVMEFWTPGL